MKWMSLLALLVVCLIAVWAHPENERKFSNTWVAEIQGGEHSARRVAKKTNFTYHGVAHGFEEHYVLKRHDLPVVSDKASPHLTKLLTSHPKVSWAEQQAYVKRAKRLFIPKPKTAEREATSRFWDARKEKHIKKLLINAKGLPPRDAKPCKVREGGVE